MQIYGALVIFLGVFIVVAPSLLGNNQRSSPLSMLIYTSSNIPYSFSFAFKENGFKNLSIHVIYLTMWVSLYQFAFGFLMVPLQFLPGMGSDEGMNASQIGQEFYRGILCFVEVDDRCRDNHAFLFLVGFCIVNFAFNTAGLYLVKLHSATLNSISYAIVLPLTTLTFSIPLLGKFQEPFQATTLVGLVVVLVGFFLWKSETLYKSYRYGFKSMANLFEATSLTKELEMSANSSMQKKKYFNVNDLEILEDNSIGGIFDDDEFDMFYDEDDEVASYQQDEKVKESQLTRPRSQSNIPRGSVSSSPSRSRRNSLPSSSPNHQEHLGNFNERLIIGLF